MSYTWILQKLYQFGICGTLLKWFGSYLHGRSQRVRLNNFVSRPIFVTSGVPQGSHLGPFLFLVFINDIALCIKHSEFLLYADDFKLFIRVRSEEESQLLKQDLRRVFEWYRINGLNVNLDKSFYVVFSNRTAGDYVYELDGNEITRRNVVKDLGVLFDVKLSFKDHIDYAVSKSFKKLYYIHRKSALLKNVQTLVTIYNALVKPVLLYASTIWRPHYDVDWRSLDKVQHFFLRSAAVKVGKRMSWFDHDYSEISNEISVCGLNATCDYNDLFKMFNNYVDAPALLEKFNIRVPGKIFRNYKQLFRVPIYTHCEKSIICRMSKLGNEYSGVDIFNSTISKFKAEVKVILFN